jgi:hypothetical protein
MFDTLPGKIGAVQGLLPQLLHDHQRRRRLDRGSVRPRNLPQVAAAGRPSDTT